MSKFPQNAEVISVDGATLEFYKFEDAGVTYYGFDSSSCVPPEPMVNAFAGLKLIDENTKLIMINHKTPGGLLDKIEGDFDVSKKTRGDGLIEVVFGYRGAVDMNDPKYGSTCH